LHFLDTDCLFQFQQLQLFIGECFAARAVLRDAHQPQPCFQYLDLQLRIVRTVLGFSRLRSASGSVAR